MVSKYVHVEVAELIGTLKPALANLKKYREGIDTLVKEIGEIHDICISARNVPNPWRWYKPWKFNNTELRGDFEDFRRVHVEPYRDSCSLAIRRLGVQTQRVSNVVNAAAPCEGVITLTEEDYETVVTWSKAQIDDLLARVPELAKNGVLAKEMLERLKAVSV